LFQFETFSYTRGHVCATTSPRAVRENVRPHCWIASTDWEDAMRAIILSLAVLAGMSGAQARPAPRLDSLQAATDWINDYRRTRDVRHAPLAIRALSYYGGFKTPEASGVYVGFIAGLLGTHPEQADKTIDRMLPVRGEDQWAIVRGIAYSGLPDWRELLRRHAYQLESRQIMVADYLNGRLPTLNSLAITPSPTTWQRVKDAFAIDWPGTKKPGKPAGLEPTQEVLDALWGYYLASGSYRPVLRMVEMLPWSNDRDNVDRLTIGSMAKYTLATNASRDAELLHKLQTIRNAKSQSKEARSKETAALLDEVIRAAETADTARLRKDALAAIEQLKIKGPHYKREVSTWAKVGQGALAVGCVTAAALGQIEFGLPCVIGGGATNAAMYYMSN
jgi:hypothetical protein